MTRPSLYSTVGENLTRYDVDVAAATLARRESMQLLSNVQYAWPHPSKPILYIATSNRGSDPKSDYNHLAAYRIDPETGALSLHGEAQRTHASAVHIQYWMGIV